VYRNLRIVFILIFDFTTLSGNYFEDNPQAFGKTMLGLFNQLSDHRRSVELNAPKD
jgi:hypothetical protein